MPGPDKIYMARDHLSEFSRRKIMNYISVDPKQFTVSKFRLKPVILISGCFCSRCGHTNQHPPPHEGRQPDTTGDKTTSEPKKAATPTTPHPPHEGRQRETTGDKTTLEPKKPTTPTNTEAARSKVAVRTPTVNCLQKNEDTSRLEIDLVTVGIPRN